MIDNPFTMVVFIIGIVMTSVVLMVRFKSEARRNRLPAQADMGLQRETRRLSDEVEQLRDRLAVLERITIEKENSLVREIESLRDR